jgi:hypothetical protein
MTIPLSAPKGRNMSARGQSVAASAAQRRPGIAANTSIFRPSPARAKQAPPPEHGLPQKNTNSHKRRRMRRRAGSTQLSACCRIFIVRSVLPFRVFLCFFVASLSSSRPSLFSLRVFLRFCGQSLPRQPAGGIHRAAKSSPVRRPSCSAEATSAALQPASARARRSCGPRTPPPEISSSCGYFCRS